MGGALLTRVLRADRPDVGRTEGRPNVRPHGCLGGWNPDRRWGRRGHGERGWGVEAAARCTAERVEDRQIAESFVTPAPRSNRYVLHGPLLHGDMGAYVLGDLWAPPRVFCGRRGILGRDPEQG